MTTTHASPLARLIVPIIKPAIALFAALAIGSAWAVAYTESTEFTSAVEVTEGSSVVGSSSAESPVVFSAVGDMSGLTVTTGNMTLSSGYWEIASGKYHFASDLVLNSGLLTVSGGTVSTEWWLPIRGGGLVVDGGTVSVGPANGGRLVVSQGDNQDCSVTVKSGTLNVNGMVEAAYGTSGSVATVNVVGGEIVVNGDYQVAENGVGTCTVGGGDSTAKITVPTTVWAILTDSASANGTLTLKRNGSFICPYLNANSSNSHLVLDGGALVKNGNVGNRQGYLIGSTTAGDAANAEISVTANGGTIDVGSIATTVGASLTGAGTLIKKGSGALTLSGDLTGFTGKLQVREGSVVIPSASTSIAPGASTIKTVVGETTVFTPLVVTALNLDFEDSDTYSSGWSLSGNGGHGQENRTLADSSTSNFLRIHTGTGSGDRRYTASYSLPAILASASGYTLEFDWFAAQNAIYGETSLDMGLYVYAGNDVKVRIVSNPVTNGGNYARIYLNGSSVAETTTLATASARNYSNESESSTSGCTGTANQDKWYHVILRANSNDGLTLQILKNDLQTVVFEETKVCDFINLTRVYLDMNKRRSNFSAYSGFDDILATIPASAMFDGVGYLSVQDAIDAAAASARETKTVLLLDDVTEDVTISAAGTILNLGSFSLTGTVSAGSGMVVAYDSVANTWRCSADVSTYTWTNASTDNQWTTIGNWLAGNEVATELPSSDTTVVFPASETPWEVELSGSVAVDELQFYGSTSLSGAVVSANAISGDAAITLMRGAGLGNRGFEMAFSNPIFVPADSTATNVLYASGADLNYSGSLTGSGNLQFRVTAGYGVNYSGVCSEFAGTILVLNTDGNNTSTLSGSALSGSSYAKWVVYNYSNNNNTGAAPNFVDGVGQTVNFGELSGSYQRCRAAMYNGSNVLVIGGLNTDFSLGGQFGTNNGGRYDKIRKVGSGTMTFTGTMAGAYEVNEGVIYLASANSYPSLADSNTYVKFGGGTLKLDAVYTHDISTNISRAASMSSIMIDDGGVNRTWEVALPSTCVGGLTKKGEGSLTLAAVPAYTGPTKVEAGALYVVEGGEWTPTLSATVEVNTDREGYRKFIPLKPSGVMLLMF